MIAHVVLDRQGDVYAVRQSPEGAQEAVRDAERYLDGAATCGHPSAVAWVAERLPLRVELVETADLDDVLSGCTPILDREP